MEKDYFLTYVNSSLRDNPKYLKHFVSNIMLLDENVEISDSDIMPFAYISAEVEIYDNIGDTILILNGSYKVNFPPETDNIKIFDIDYFLSFAMTIPYLVKLDTTY